MDGLDAVFSNGTDRAGRDYQAEFTTFMPRSVS
jgi:hypothetical protein